MQKTLLAAQSDLKLLYSAILNLAPNRIARQSCYAACRKKSYQQAAAISAMLGGNRLPRACIAPKALLAAKNAGAGRE